MDVPLIDGEPAPYLERFFVAHGDHAHALQSPVFPLLAAPFIAAGGVQYTFVLPAASFVFLAFAAFRTARILFPDQRGMIVAVCATVASPLFFYSLEFWEHTPAAACISGSMWLLASNRASDTRYSVPGAMAGALAAIGALLRPEAMWVAVVLLLLSPSTRLAFLMGLALPITTYAVANVVEAGSPVGFHVAANLAATPDRWLATRIDRAFLWLAGC